MEQTKLTLDDLMSLIYDDKYKEFYADAKRECPQAHEKELIFKATTNVRSWYWACIFKNVEINEDTKTVVINVIRPNKFIKPLGNKKKDNYLLQLENELRDFFGYKVEFQKIKDETEWTNAFFKNEPINPNE